MTLANSGIKRRQLPPLIKVAPAEKEWKRKNGGGGEEGWMRRIREQMDGK